MQPEMATECPECGSTDLYRAASTIVHLGVKVKYRCSECGHDFVHIGDAVDTSTA